MLVSHQRAQIFLFVFYGSKQEFPAESAQAPGQSGGDTPDRALEACPIAQHMFLPRLFQRACSYILSTQSFLVGFWGRGGELYASGNEMEGLLGNLVLF